MTNRIHQNGDPDWAIRAQAFAMLERLAISTGVPIPWAEISKWFLHQDERIHFASRALGIIKPRQMTAALSIKTVMTGAADLLSCRSRAAHLVRGDLAGVGRGLQGGSELTARTPPPGTPLFRAASQFQALLQIVCQKPIQHREESLLLVPP